MRVFGLTILDLAVSDNQCTCQGERDFYCPKHGVAALHSSSETIEVIPATTLTRLADELEERADNCAERATGAIEQHIGFMYEAEARANRSAASLIREVTQQSAEHQYSLPAKRPR